MIYIILGAQMTGKGTRAKILAKEFSIPHISTGEIFRTAAKENEEIRNLINKGIFINDELTSNLVFERIQKEDCGKGFILDGYPRNIEQVKYLEDMLSKLDREITKVIELVAPKELLFARFLARRECPNCKKTFGLDFPSKAGDNCDNCGTRLERREDDTEEALKVRLETYEEKTKPIVDYYKEKGLLKTVDSSNHPENIANMVN